MKWTWKKEAWAAIAVALVAVILFIASMASMARLGQAAGETFRGTEARGMSGPGTTRPGAFDTGAAAGTVRHDTAPTIAEDTSSVLPDGEEAAPVEAGGTAAIPRFGSPQPGPGAGVPVLCYHYLRASSGVVRVAKVLLYVVLSLPVLDDNELWTLSEGAFEKQMRWLHENGYRTVTLDELTEWQYGRRPLPPKSVAITFDDGDRSVYDVAWPILEKYGFTASYFVITRHIGETWRDLEFLSWGELREMSESGTFRVESHTHDLHYKVGEKSAAKPVFLAAHDGGHHFDGFDDYRDRLRDDLTRSHHLIARYVGRAPRYLAWPYGHSEPALDLLAHDAGYDRTALLEAGTNESFVPTRGDTLPLVDRIPIRRYTITARTSLRDFREMVTGEYVPPDQQY